MNNLLKLTPPQQEILDQDLLDSGFNCLLQMPTGSGKTWLATQAAKRTSQRGLRTIYLAPTRALARELYENWKTIFNHQVGIFTGDYGKPGIPYPVNFRDAQVLIMTPERLDACTRHWRTHWHWLPEVDLLIVDEFHLLGDGIRGARLEGTLSRFRRLNPFARIHGLSATLGNCGELADWLQGVEYQSNWRPIPLTWHIERYRRAADKPEILAAILQDPKAAEGQTLVFVQSRRRAEFLSQFLSNTGIPSQHHHAGLSQIDRIKTEDHFRSGEIRVLIATATLEVGLNLPVCRVILYDLQHFDGVDFRPLPTINVWQRVGRAGRPGFDMMGEAILMAPTWDHNAARYKHGNFEPIQSGLADEAALAEQIVVEVSSGLARTQAEIDSVFSQSLAAHQNRLPESKRIINEMIRARLLRETSDDDVAHAPLKIRATRLGRIAARQLLSPITMLRFRQALVISEELSFLDLLVIACSATDCEPVLPVDFEELEMLASLLITERSTLLNKPLEILCTNLEISHKRLLASVKMALVARALTRQCSIEEIARDTGCYFYEVNRLQESLNRLLPAMAAILEAEDPTALATSTLDDSPPGLRERIQVLAKMLETGLDEHHVTLTLIPGIGPNIAKRMVTAGIEDIEDLAQTESENIQIPGVSSIRLSKWAKVAETLMQTHTVYRYREIGPTVQITPPSWPAGIEPYRLRRALELSVKPANVDSFQVTGGLDPHIVTLLTDDYQCDCTDFSRGYLCKHILAVRLSRNDRFLMRLTERVGDTLNNDLLDLFSLWFDREITRKVQ